MVKLTALSCEDCLNVSEQRISLWSDLIDQPESIKYFARKSSNSGFDGGSPNLPKLLGVGTIPFPKCHAQTRLEMTLEVKGLSGDVMASANSVRQMLRRQQIDLIALERFLRRQDCNSVITCMDMSFVPQNKEHCLMISWRKPIRNLWILNWMSSGLNKDVPILCQLSIHIHRA